MNSWPVGSGWVELCAGSGRRWGNYNQNLFYQVSTKKKKEEKKVRSTKEEHREHEVNHVLLKCDTLIW